MVLKVKPSQGVLLKMVLELTGSISLQKKKKYIYIIYFLVNQYLICHSKHDKIMLDLCRQKTLGDIM